ncbi:BLOC-2 complex member HPS3 [Spea bombifrons]|uniref:BLOC-2 complex member HPS3 n=1 Tax=Spea bombifrons TaxID=233779 RepID=UPI00234B718C|nr:BLOC-2 complex member HPS3 [Spea bombifrons]
MVQLYNCHPYGSQLIVPTKQVPELFCCGRDSVFVTCAGGCKVEVFTVSGDLCQPLCSFNTLGKVLRMTYSDVGDYLVTIEEKNNISYLRAYMNWRCQATGTSRVSVRMVGLQMESLHSGTSKDQMEIIEMPLSEPPVCLACCPMRGDLLVGCKTKLVVFSLKYVSIHDTTLLDFERSLILHVTGMAILQVKFCAEYVSILSELEVLIVKLIPPSSEAAVATSRNLETQETLPDQGNQDPVPGSSPPLQPDDFVVCQRPVELTGEECKSCNVSVTPELTGLSSRSQSPSQVLHIMYRHFAPDFSEGISVENTRLHSLQLLPMYKTGRLVAGDQTSSPQRELLSLFCFFSMPHTGYLYTVGNVVELISVYRYPERSQQAVLTPQFLHVITSNNLLCYTVRCSAVAARDEDPYIDTTMKTCPPVSLDVCTLRMQLFIGLKAMEHFKNYIIILTKAHFEDVTEKGRNPKSSKKAGSVKGKVPVETEPNWNLYVVSTMSTIQLYNEMVEYSKKYDTMKTQSSIHLLSEAHLLVRAALMAPHLEDSAEKAELLAVYRESCASLGHCYSRLDTKYSHLALPYFKMSCLSMSEVINRVLSDELPQDRGKGFMFYLKHSLLEELDEELGEEMALKVLQIFNDTEPAQLPCVLCSPCMKNVCPKKAIGYLEKAESASNSGLVSLTKASMALRMNDPETCKNQMDQQPEMLLLCGFMNEPRLLLIHRNKEIIPTQMAFHLKETQPGLLVASIVALHENGKIKLKDAEIFFKVLCENSKDEENIPQMLVDFWEALLSTYPPDSVLHDILFKLSSRYVCRICKPQHICVSPLKNAEDLRNSCSHFGLISPWITKMVASESTSCYECGDLIKLQSLLCGPSMDIGSFLPFLEFIPDDDNTTLSIHIICETRLMEYEKSIDRLLDRCPEAVIQYARHELRDRSQALWWNKMLPELCSRIRESGNKNTIFISSLRDTLEVISTELELQDFVNLLPDDGVAAFFLPYLLNQNKRKLVT